MKFTRVDNETVNCLITAEDLDEQGIQLQDFFDRKQEAMDFIRNVLERAAEEVDYHPGGVYLPMQITVLPDRSLSLTLSENPNTAMSDLLRTLVDQTGLILPEVTTGEHKDTGAEGENDENNPSHGNMEQLSGYLQGLRHFATALRQLLDEKTDNNRNVSTEEAKPGESSPIPVINGDEDRIRFSSCVFEFENLHSIIALCSQIPGEVRVGGTLYRGGENDHYYLVIRKQDEKAKVFASVFTMAYEFGKYVTTNEYVISALNENMELVIGEDAISILRGL